MATVTVRLDKWLWAARFFKTRGLACDAVAGGKVHVNGARCKPSRSVRSGDTIEILCPAGEFTITVRELSAQRGSAHAARILYEETAESAQRRTAAALERRLQICSAPHPARRPTKRDRRRIIHLMRGQ